AVEAETKTITKRVLKTPATTQEVAVEAKYETRTYEKLVSAATTRVIEIPAESKTISRQVVKEAAKTEVIEVPGETKTISYQKLVTPAGTNVVEIPAEYKTVTKKQLVSKGGFSEWREILCPADVTEATVRSVQRALRDAGYDPGPLDNILGARTKAALIKYQKDKGLPVGNLDIETLKALGLR
ncbi:MAG: peptidoglycan-binding domain-containing protein, partial [Bacteroidota bacterium]